MINEVVEGLKELSNSNDPFVICGYLDVVVVEEPLGDEVMGYYQQTQTGLEILHINSSLDYHYKKYVCAHELGHAILEPSMSISFFIDNPLMVKNRSEIKADKFAALLLIDDDVLNRIEYENFTLDQIALAENLPVELFELKFGIEL